MRVLIVNSLYPPQRVGGAERSVELLARQLHTGNHTVAVACTRPEPGTARDERDGVRVYRVGLRNVDWSFGQHDRPAWRRAVWHVRDTWNTDMAREVGRIMDAERPDVVHTNNLAGFSVGVWRQASQRRLPVVHTLRDYYLMCPRATMFRRGTPCVRACAECRFFSFPRRRASHHVDAVVGNSRYTLERHLGSGYFKSSPVRAVVFSPCESVGPVRARRDRGGALRLGYLGRVEPSKGVHRLLDALDSAPPGEWRLEIAGRGHAGYVQALRTEDRSANVSFLGFVEPRQLFERIDFLVVPSLWPDVLPRSILEAYAHGIPVIAAANGGIPEIVDAGRTGFLFDPNDAGSLRRIVESLLAAPERWAEMGEAARLKANEFEPQSVASQYLGLYRQATGVAAPITS